MPTQFWSCFAKDACFSEQMELEELEQMERAFEKQARKNFRKQQQPRKGLCKTLPSE